LFYYYYQHHRIYHHNENHIYTFQKVADKWYYRVKRAKCQMLSNFDPL
jgi:hypothetical protein